LHDLDQAAQAAAIGVGQAIQNIVQGWQQMSSSPQASSERSQQIPSMPPDQRNQYGKTQAESDVYARRDQTSSTPSMPQGQPNQYGKTQAESDVYSPRE
jgi:hypothetical protein